MDIQIISPQEQAKGEFDGGKITEQKPIGFPGEGSRIRRLGPLFYWAWAQTAGEGSIGLHPHQGFEIMTYVIGGNAHHKDTLGTNSIVGPGGVQLIQAGSGVSHAEAMHEPSELFQIWLEPHLSKALQRHPAYFQYEHEEFPNDPAAAGVQVKTIIGEGAPIQLVADAAMQDVTLEPGAAYRYPLAAGRILSGLAIRGNGTIAGHVFDHKDFVVANGEQAEDILIQADTEPLRIFLIDVPAQVNYTLYNKRA
jgi:redox-sensitive bicupin YhaK (pirin superfamily)